MPPNTPIEIINSFAPIRICDNGGWTDTWFAGHGKIFNIAVSPYVEVQIKVFSPRDWHDELLDESPAPVIIQAENFTDRYLVHPDKRWGKHPILEAALASMNLPNDLGLEINIYSEAPGGASTGTSAAVSVALIGALDLLTPGRLTPHEIAYAAQKVETELLGQQCGIQDQLCSAYGGINWIDMHTYPYASVSPIRAPTSLWWELERRLVLIYLGKSHQSSQVHEMVIRSLEDAGPGSKSLQELRVTAENSRDAIYAGDLVALGKAMCENTEAQARLHPALVNPDAYQVIEIARQYGALGWKVNGAGGEGGSLTLLCGESSQAKRAMIATIEAENMLFKNIPIGLSRAGLCVWRPTDFSQPK